MPFGEYKDFDECVAQNQDKENPEAYCAQLHYNITGQWPAQMSKGGAKRMERLANDSLEAKLDQIREAIWSAFEGKDMGTVHTFDDAVIIKDYSTEELMEVPYSIMDGKVILGEVKAVENIYVSKRLMEANAELSGADLGAVIVEYSKDSAATLKALSEGVEGVDDPAALETWLHYQAEGQWPTQDRPGSKKPSIKKVIQRKAPSTQQDSPELTGPIVFKNDEKRIAYGAVLVPGELDSDGEAVTAEKVEAAAHEWMELYQNIDLQHTLNNVGVPVESYLTPVEMTVKSIHGDEEMVIPKGTWILGGRLDEDSYEAAKKGDLTGYSIMGMRRAALKSQKGEVTAALKRTLLRDLGEDWVPVYVSVVDRPAVPKAKFFALKGHAQPDPEDSPEQPSIWEKITKAFSPKEPESAEKEGRKFSKTTVERMKAAYEALAQLVSEAEAEADSKESTGSGFFGSNEKSKKGGESELTEDEIKKLVTDSVSEAMKGSVEEAVKSAMEEAVKPLKEEVEALKTASTTPEPPDKKQDGDPESKGDPDPASKSQEPSPDTKGDDEPGDGDVPVDDLEAFKSDINTKLDAFMGEVSKKLGVDSSALKGQDGAEDNPPPAAPARSVKRIERDAFGRSIIGA